MYTIGQFSRIGMVSSSALRFYDEIGLLKPCSIDSATGYRYYSEAQVGDILFICEMREYGFSLDEIKLLLNNKENRLLEDSLANKYNQLFWEEQKITYIRRKLKFKIDNLEGDDLMDTTNQDGKAMEVKVATREETVKTVGISKLIPTWPPENPEVFGELWTQYWDKDISSQIPNRRYPSVRYGILTFEEGAIHYLITDEVTSYDNVPDQLIKFDIPKGRYAVCTFNGETFDEMVTYALQRATDYLLTTWLPQSNYKHQETFSLEVYDERSRRKDYPEMDICQPITEI